jgi:transposase-like protein
MANGKGRSGRGEAYWRRIVRQQGAGGLTVREFCRRSDLRESTFYFWRRELLRREASQQGQAHGRPPSKAAFVPVCVTTGAVEWAAHEDTLDAPPHIEIVLAGGRRIHVTAPVDRQALADVVAVLDARRPEGHAC